MVGSEAESTAASSRVQPLCCSSSVIRGNCKLAKLACEWLLAPSTQLWKVNEDALVHLKYCRLLSRSLDGGRGESVRLHRACYLRRSHYYTQLYAVAIGTPSPSIIIPTDIIDSVRVSTSSTFSQNTAAIVLL
jgi:hypothetical protein